MALILCKQCGKNVSSMAKKCPHCHCQMLENNDQPKIIDNNKSPLITNLFKMNTKLLDNESQIKYGGANLQKGLEAVGGHLYLTSQRLIFESHKFNVQSGFTIIHLNEIIDVCPCWTKFLNIIPIFPNSMEVSTKDGIRYKFVCFGRSAWIEEIKKYLNK